MNSQNYPGCKLENKISSVFQENASLRKKLLNIGSKCNTMGQQKQRKKKIQIKWGREQGKEDPRNLTTYKNSFRRRSSKIMK